jgi:hypothetical protein
MNEKLTEKIYRVCLLVVVIFLSGFASGCAHRLYAPMQPTGWSVRPIVNACRFAPDADLDPATGTPIGDAGYYLYILTDSAKWDFSYAPGLLFSIWMRPAAHSWMILERPGERLEFGHTGDFGLVKPRYHLGVIQKIQEGDPNPIAYLWQTMADGEFQLGKPPRPPTFVWKMPITQRRYQRIYEYAMSRKYDQFGLRSNNCTDMVAATAALAGINLIHRIRLTLPSETKFLGKTARIWTDPQYSILEFSTPEVLEVDLRQLAQLGIGSDVTGWYLALNTEEERTEAGP